MIRTGAGKFAVTPQAEKANKDDFESAEVSRAYLHCSYKPLQQNHLRKAFYSGQHPFMDDAANSNLEQIASVDCCYPLHQK